MLEADRERGRKVFITLGSLSTKVAKCDIFRREEENLPEVVYRDSFPSKGTRFEHGFLSKSRFYHHPMAFARVPGLHANRKCSLYTKRLRNVNSHENGRQVVSRI